MADKKSFILYIERKKEIDMLSNEQCGILFKAIFEYVDTGNIPEIEDLAVKLMFSVFKAQINREAEKWKETCRKRSEAGKKGMATRWGDNKNNKVKQTITSDNKTKQTITNITDNDNDNDNVLSLSKDNDNIKQAGTAPLGAVPPADENLIPWDEVDFELV